MDGGGTAVAPSGRIDAIWYDTRGSGRLPNVAQLFYAYSWDGGPDLVRERCRQPRLRQPPSATRNQGKIGDYITIVSARRVADVAYTATFNGEQDVYHVRVFPDCNGNGVSDVTDIASAAECRLQR